MRFLFVDGYNVINKWYKIDEFKGLEFDDFREELIHRLVDYSGFTGDKVYIVFDAHLKENSLEKVDKIGKVEVVFTKTGETADSYIEKFVNGIGKKYEVCVVTDDNLEKQTTFQRGASRMGSLELYFELQRHKNKVNERIKGEFVNNRNLLGENIDVEILKKLEKMRRSR